MLLYTHTAPGERPSPQVSWADGVRLRLEDGREVLDFGASPTILGHRHPHLAAALRKAADAPALAESYHAAEREGVADRLLATAFRGEGWAAGVRFCTTATEAIDLGLSLAQALTGRSPLVARELAYHGAAGLAREVSTYPLWKGALAGPSGGWRSPPRLADVRCIPAPACSAECGPEHCRDADLDPAPEALDGAAATITDFGSGGIYPCAAYGDRLAALTAEAGALWLQDEAVTGFGRSGRWFAFQRGERRPAMVALGKALTAGYAPGGALVLSADALAAIGQDRWLTFSTWRGHTLTLAAIRATMEVVERDGLLERAARLGELIATRLSELRERHDSVRRIAGEGLVWNIDLVGPPELEPASWRGRARGPTPAQRLMGEALDRGLLVRPMGALGVWLFPPMIAEDADVELAAEALDEALTGLDVADRTIGVQQA